MNKAVDAERNEARAALLLMDLMPIVVPAFGGDDELLTRLAGAAEVARRSDIDVIHVRVLFRDGYPEVASTNKIFGVVTANFDFTENNPATEVHQALRPRESDILVTKRRISAFAGSDLEMILRSRRIQTLVLAGVATSGVVLSTLRAAADLDYRIKVLSDGCADGDTAVHRMLLENVFPAHADVLAVDEWVAGLG
ncbi:cysteine hydrolase family protein [Rhodococcus sp. NPDC059968]|uniref:cysteine hydrolase family protein n=1 Tax=Rhodococcus sp. NPDC059968 TaxID=3347017 RepID=UPI00366B1E57